MIHLVMVIYTPIHTYIFLMLQNIKYEIFVILQKQTQLHTKKQFQVCISIFGQCVITQ